MRKLVHWIPIVTTFALLAFAGTGCTARFKASYHLKRADRFFDSGQYERAEIEYRNVVRNAPENLRAWQRLGVIYFDEGRSFEAMPVLLRAEQMDPSNADVRLKLGALYLGFGQLKQAQNEADFVLSQNPRDPQGPLLLANAAATNEFVIVAQRLQQMQQGGASAPLETALGILALRQHDLKTASARFTRAIALDPKSSEAYTGLASLYFGQHDFKDADHAFQTAATLAPVWSGCGLRYAQFKILSGNTSEAENMLQDITQKTPSYMPAWIARAQLLAADNDYSNALILLANVLNRDPRNFEGLLLQGRLELLEGQPALAVANYNQMARLYPEVPGVLFNLAQAYLANNQTNEADASLTEALNLKPDYTDAILLRSETEIAHGNPALAIVALKQLVQQQPGAVQAWLLLAAAYRAQGTPNSAVEIYDELEKSLPDKAQVPVLLGSLYFQQRQFPAARAEFQKALQLEPNYLPAVEQLVDLDLAEKQYSAALQRVQHLMVQDPNRALLQLLLGTTLAARGETNQAETALSKAITLQPDSQAAYLLLAQLYSQTGQNQKALKNLQIALAKDPNDMAAVMLEGILYNSEGNYDDARDAYTKLLAIAPDNAIALNNLACIYADHLNQLDASYPLARQARDLAPSDPAIADTLGWILYRRKEYVPALVFLRESVKELYSVPEVQFHLGMACYMAGYESDAMTALGRALQLGGDFPEKNECSCRLAILNINPKQSGTETRVWLEKWTTSQPYDPVALAKLAAVYQSNGMIDKAISTDQTILNNNPQNVFALRNLAQLYASTDPQKACSFAKSAYELAPRDPEVTHLYGRLAFKTRDYPWALTLLQLSAQAQPQNPEILFDLGQAFYSEGKVSDAQTLTQKALQTGATFTQINDARRFLAMTALADNAAQAVASQSEVNQILGGTPDYVPALMVKAAICAEKSDTATARQIYSRVLNIYPDFAPAQRDLVVLDAENPENDTDALPLAVKAHQAFPNDPSISKSLGIIVCRQGDYSHAASLLEESARQLTHDPELFYYLGLAQFHLNDAPQSKADLQRALNLDLSGQNAANARHMLTELE